MTLNQIAETFELRSFLLICYRWNSLLEQISEQLRSSKALLVLWQRYRSSCSQCVTAVQKQEDRADRLLKSATDREITEEESSAWIMDCDVSPVYDYVKHFFSQQLELTLTLTQSLCPLCRIPNCTLPLLSA